MGNAVAARRAAPPALSGRALRVLKDEKLAAMVAAGSDDAFAVLYRRHHQAIYRYCLSLLGQEADARDALQGSMLAALSSLRARPIEGEFKPWLFRIAHNQSISAIRARTRETPDADPSPPASSDDPETREELRMLVADLGALPERQRGAIVMRELSGLSFAAIGAALGTSEAGGKQLVYEARTALHDLRAGHEMSCHLVRERISADDRRLLRGRKVRSHLRGCQPCQDFEHVIRRRRTALAAFAPPLAPLAAAAILGEVFGQGGGAAGGAGGAAAATGTGGIASGGAPLAGSAGLKAAAAALLAGTAGVGAYAAGTAVFSGDAASPPAAAAEAGPAPRQSHGGVDGARGASSEPRKGPGEGADGGAGPQVAAKRVAGPGAETEIPPTAGSPPAATSAAPSAHGVTETPGGGSGGGEATHPPSATPPTPSAPDTSPPPQTSPPPPTEPPPPGGDGSGVPPGTPPGHGGTVPGHGGVPPGQAGSDVPPGQLGRP